MRRALRSLSVLLFLGALTSLSACDPTEKQRAVDTMVDAGNAAQSSPFPILQVAGLLLGGAGTFLGGKARSWQERKPWTNDEIDEIAVRLNARGWKVERDPNWKPTA